MNKFGIGALSALGIGCIGAGAFCLAENAYSYGQQNATTQKDDVGQDVPAKLEDVLATFSGEYPGVVPEIVDVSDDKYVVLMGQSSYLYDNNTGDFTTINVVTQYNFFWRVGGVPYFVNQNADCFTLCIFNGSNFEEYMSSGDYQYNSFNSAEVLYTTNDLLLFSKGGLICFDFSQKQIINLASFFRSPFIDNNKMYFVGVSAGVYTINCLDLDTLTISVGPVCSFDFYDLLPQYSTDDFDGHLYVYVRDNVLYCYDGITETSILALDDGYSFMQRSFKKGTSSSYRYFYPVKNYMYFIVRNLIDEQNIETVYAYNLEEKKLNNLVSFPSGNNSSYDLYVYNTGLYFSYKNADSQLINCIYDTKFGVVSIDSIITKITFVVSCDDALFYYSNGTLFCKTETNTVSTNELKEYFGLNNKLSPFESKLSSSNITRLYSAQKMGDKYIFECYLGFYVIEIGDESLEVFGNGSFCSGDLVALTSQYGLLINNTEIIVCSYTIDYSLNEQQRLWIFEGQFNFVDIDGDIVKLTSANGSEYELDLTTKTLTCTKLNITATN